MERNQQLDFFRGACLILITINHFLSHNNIIRYFTYEFIGWVTGAEGFVFISGLTVGLVYTRSYNHRGPEYISALAFKRSWLIYRSHVCILALAFLLICIITQANNYWATTYPLVIEQPFVSFILGVALLYQPIYLDILPMYAIFMIFVPEIIKGFANNKMWLIGTISVITYLLSILANLTMQPKVGFLPNLPEYINSGFFDLLSWQLLFVLGIILGFLHYHGKTNGILNSNTLLYTSVTICITCFIIRHLLTSFPQLNLGILTNKNHLGIFRIINFVSLLNIITFISNRKSNWFKNSFIESLGKNSLNVFLLHILLLILFKPCMPYFNNIYSVKVNHHYTFYPVTSFLLFTLVIPALCLVPFLSGKRLVKQPAQVPV